MGSFPDSLPCYYYKSFKDFKTKNNEERLCCMRNGHMHSCINYMHYVFRIKFIGTPSGK